jgi:3-hydroxyanthranilate 3,4-dioxygenase
MFPHLKGFNLRQWIDENRGNWGQRRAIWQDSDFIAFVTRGPNRRKDYHINPGDEIFYQRGGTQAPLPGERWQGELALLKAGDLFLLPANVPHSPRRADGSWTFVIEGYGARRSKIALSGFVKNAATRSMRPRFALTILPMPSQKRQPR